MFILGRFIRSDQASFAPFFAIALLPMLIGFGSAVDYTRMVATRAKIQSAADAAALAAAKDAGSLTDAQLLTRATQYFEGAMATAWEDSGGYRRAGGFTRTSLTLQKNAKTIKLDVAGTMKMNFMSLAGFSTGNIAAASTSAWGITKIEVVLALDNTGSMAGQKIIQLRKAAKNLVATLKAVAKEPDAVKVALVPFATQVRLDTSLKNEPWLDFATYGTNKATWDGCVFDRDKPWDVSDGNQRLNPLDLLSKPHPAIDCWATGLARVQPLAPIDVPANVTALNAAIDAMKADGATNVTIGLTWGLTALSPGAPLSGGVAFGTPDVKKFIIMLTDGDNTRNRWTPEDASGDQPNIDARTTKACNTIKTPANGITLYTIRVMDGNASLLQACASSPAKFFDVMNASDLNAVFQKIADELTAIRLAA